MRYLVNQWIRWVGQSFADSKDGSEGVFDEKLNEDTRYPEYKILSKMVT